MEILKKHPVFTQNKLPELEHHIREFSKDLYVYFETTNLGSSNQDKKVRILSLSEEEVRKLNRRITLCGKLIDKWDFYPKLVKIERITPLNELTELAAFELEKIKENTRKNKIDKMLQRLGNSIPCPITNRDGTICNRRGCTNMNHLKTRVRNIPMFIAGDF
jgi:hypothetical protein